MEIPKRYLRTCRMGCINPNRHLFGVEPCSTTIISLGCSDRTRLVPPLIRGLRFSLAHQVQLWKLLNSTVICFDFHFPLNNRETCLDFFCHFFFAHQLDPGLRKTRAAKIEFWSTSNGLLQQFLLGFYFGRTNKVWLGTILQRYACDPKWKTICFFFFAFFIN